MPRPAARFPAARLLAWLPLALALSGCSLARPIADQAIAYNASVEQAANTLLVRNILRARDEAPLHFTTLPQIRGSLNIGFGNLGLPVGGAGSTSGLLLGFSGGTAPSFDVSALDTQEFARGLLEPLEESVIRYYWQRGLPEELLLLLLFSAVQDPDRDAVFPNDPRCWLDRPDCPVQGGASASLKAALRATLANGPMVFHPYVMVVPVGPPLTAAQAADAGVLALLAEGRVRLAPVPGGRFQLQRREPRVAACRSVRADGRAMLLPVAGMGVAPMRGDAAVCVQEEVTAAEAAPSPRPHRAWRIEVRSVQDVLRFLGILVRVQADMPRRPDGEAPCITFTLRPGRTACLFRLARQGVDAPPPAVAWTVEHGGATWLVPAFAEPGEDGRPGDYTLRVLALLTELLNLKKSSTAIPSTRAVQVVR
ncbi:hypothetical protein [Paracraurococcus ruber]|uniref:Lipoprotein n=1 Tax=Paracraurococcus ruber TaxID=77675 RepID=A0ABS1D6Y6_9PROT|nr:hypothetical protein [Paracraurococcus ruber]MBK1662017.1 hypothetical protein [Paracraurococcus ruber]TDG27241.1 hypothetical protein E2C05_23565 [Paracraurococcus ruber]